MLPKERRAYWLGYRRAKAQTRRELREMGQHLDDEIVGLADETQAALDSECEPDMLLNRRPSTGA